MKHHVSYKFVLSEEEEASIFNDSKMIYLGPVVKQGTGWDLNGRRTGRVTVGPFPWRTVTAGARWLPEDLETVDGCCVSLLPAIPWKLDTTANSLMNCCL